MKSLSLSVLTAGLSLASIAAVRAADPAPAGGAPAATSPAAATAAAPAAAPLQEKPFWSAQWGGDERIRQEYMDNVPVSRDPPGVTRGGLNDYFRFRTRLWGQVNAGDSVALKLRLANEWRDYRVPKNTVWDYPDETIVDNLYLDLKDLGGIFDLRVGRQDLMYGNGRVILEGTPKDGSRTIYMDAVKLTLKSIPKTTVDFLGIYTEPENQLAMSSEDRDLTGQLSGFNDITESGGGVYVKNNSSEVLPFEAYYLFKQESDWDSGPSTNLVHHDTLNLNTFGFRLMPKFSEAVVGNLEAAYQFGEQGDRDVTGSMVDASLKSRLGKTWDPWVGAGYYFLSGDDPDTRDIEGWNPLWARWPQYSELYIYAWDTDGAARWSNLSMPYLEFSMYPFPRYKLSLFAGLMMADQNDGPGDGTERGWLYVWKNEFKVAENLFRDKDNLKMHLWLEVLEPGDYYKVDNTSIFARWELFYTF